MPSQVRTTGLTPRLWRCVLLSVLLLSAPVFADAPDPTKKAAELEVLRDKIRELQAGLAAARGQMSSERRELQRVETEIGATVQALRELKADSKRQQKRLKELAAEKKRLDADLARQRDALRGQVRAAYATGRQERLKILLNQQDPDTISRILRYHDYFQKARTEQIRFVETNLNRLAAVAREAEQARDRLAAVQKEQQARKLALESSKTTHKQIIASLSKDIKGKSNRLDNLAENEKRLKDLLEQLRIALVDIPPEPGEQVIFRKSRGNLPWPTRGRIIKHFGRPRDAGSLRWSGVVIAAPEGADVLAVAGGRVAFSDWLRGFGLLLIIDHGDGFMSLYGYNESLYKETGDWVESGEAVATVGTSGAQQRSSLYFEIRREGKPVNPVKWCLRPGRGFRVGMIRPGNSGILETVPVLPPLAQTWSLDGNLSSSGLYKEPWSTVWKNPGGLFRSEPLSRSFSVEPVTEDTGHPA